MNNTRAALVDAEQKAITLFNAIESRGLIAAGKTDRQLNSEIYKLAKELFGIKKFWHKRIVRSGANTLHPYRVNPPALTLQDNDILFFDFGPVFEDWEADLGRTYVIGNDHDKLKLKADVEKAWYEVQQWYATQHELSGAQLYEYIGAAAVRYGWELGGYIGGHIIGKFPHEKLSPRNYGLYIHPKNELNMRRAGTNGEALEWILEIHFVNNQKQIGGFFEQLMT